MSERKKEETEDALAKIREQKDNIDRVLRFRENDIRKLVVK